MSVKNKILAYIESEEFLAYLIALILSTLLIGFAPSSIAVGIFIFFSAKYAIAHKQIPKLDIKLLLPIIMYLLFLLSLFWTVDVEQTKKGVDRTVVLLLIPVAFSIIPKFTQKSFDLILRIFTEANILFGLFFLISAITRYISSSSLSVFTYHELVSDLELNAIYVSVIFAISLFYLLSTKEKNTIHLVKIIFLSFLIILLSSKTLLFVFVLGSIVYILWFRLSRIKLILTILLGLLIAGFASKKTIERLIFEKETKANEVWTKNEFGQVYLWTGTSIRLFQLRLLKEQLEEENIFWKGFGLFASKDNLKRRHMEFNTYPGFHSYNYHNQYAQIFSEMGIFGLLLLLSMLGVMLVRAVLSRNYMFVMFVVTIIFVFFTESLLWRQTGLFLFIVLYCLFNRTILKANKNHSFIDPRVKP